MDTPKKKPKLIDRIITYAAILLAAAVIIANVAATLSGNTVNGLIPFLTVALLLALAGLYSRSENPRVWVYIVIVAVILLHIVSGLFELGII